MTLPQIEAALLLAAALGLFMWGRIRHDIVALLALLAAVVMGLVPADGAFAGFGHPAVITVAAVLIISAALSSSGLVDLLIRRIVPEKAGPTTTVLTLGGATAFISAWMNNVGALALTMPAAIRLGRQADVTPSMLLMPIAFAAVLGGIVTLIGTPPNLIVSGFRPGGGFALFDFAPVGVVVAGAGVIYLALLGWRLIPKERRGKRPPQELFDVGPYVTELAVADDSPLAGQLLHAVDAALGADIEVIGIVRDKRRVFAPRGDRMVRPGDVLIVRSDPETLKTAVAAHRVELAAAKPLTRSALETDEVSLQEAVVRPGSVLTGMTARLVRLRSRYAVNLVAVTRGGEIERKRLQDHLFQPGDVLLLQGSDANLADVFAAFGVAPLAERKLALATPQRLLFTLGPIGLAVASTLAGAPAEIAFLAAALAYVLLGAVPLREMYAAVDWPVIVLLGALMPVADAVETSGLAALIAQQGIAALAGGSAPLALAILLVATMLFSDILNNAATAAIMCPIALQLAAGYGASPDAFLMAVAVGASCAFLTPIGHQNNTIILGPGGYKFIDYVRVGAPLEILVVALGVPMLLWVWPL